MPKLCVTPLFKCLTLMFVFAACGNPAIQSGTKSCPQISKVFLAEGESKALSAESLGAVFETLKASPEIEFQAQNFESKIEEVHWSSGKLDIVANSTGGFSIRIYTASGSVSERIYLDAYETKAHVWDGTSYLKVGLKRGVEHTRKIGSYGELLPITAGLTPELRSELRVSFSDFGLSPAADLRVRAINKTNDPNWAKTQIFMCSDDAGTSYVPTPTSCLWTTSLDVFTMEVADEDAIALRPQLTELAQRSAALQKQREEANILSTQLVSDLKNYERLLNDAKPVTQRLRSLAYLRQELRRTDCRYGCPNKEPIVRAIVKTMLPGEAALTENIIKAGYTEASIVPLTALADAQKLLLTAPYARLTSVYKAISEALPKHKEHLALEGNHLIGNVVKPGALSYRSIPLFSAIPAPELFGWTAKVDQGRLLLEPDLAKAVNLTNSLHEGSVVTLAGFPIAVYKVNQKQSDGLALLPLPATPPRVKRPDTAENAPSSKPSAAPKQPGRVKNDESRKSSQSETATNCAL